MKKAFQAYRATTPIKWQRIGNSGLMLTSSLSAIMQGAPMSEHAVAMVTFGLNAAGVLFKVITNFTVEEPKEETKAPELPEALDPK